MPTMLKTMIVMLGTAAAALLASGCGGGGGAAADAGSPAPIAQSDPSVGPNPADNPPGGSNPSTPVEDAGESSESALGAIGSGFGGIFGSFGEFLDDLTGGGDPGKLARMTQADNPDSRRVGINGLVRRDFGKTETYTALYRKMAAEDADPIVRATAIRALNQARDAEATKLFIRALEDPSTPVRLEAAKALHRVPDPDAARPLLGVLGKPDEDRDVRIAAAEALKHYRQLEVARGLVAMLTSRDFGLAYQAHQSLAELTGRDLKYDEAAWLQYLTGPEKPFG